MAGELPVVGELPLVVGVVVGELPVVGVVVDDEDECGDEEHDVKSPMARTAAAKPAAGVAGAIAALYRPRRTVRSKMPSVARRAEAGTMGKRSFNSPSSTWDQS